ncbi:MAG: hypothetical protein RL026_2209 [Pseudomonadota bacterium]|jgi:colicin import membrane protein
MTAGREGWSLPFLGALLVHAGLIGVAVLLWWRWPHAPPEPQQLLIEATVVASAAVEAATPTSPAPPAPVATPEPAPSPAPEPEPERQAPPPPPPVDKAAEARKAEEQRRANLAHEAEQARQREAARRRADEQALREKAEAEARAAQLQRQQEAELRDRLAAEERLRAAQANGLLAQYQARIRDRIERAWIRPASARAGLSCELRIRQIPGGEVVGVSLGACNGDEAVRQSIEAAAYRASPLPLPADPALFERNLVVTFRPEQ